jgi:hypothetical protein
VHGPGLKGDNKNLIEQSSELRKLQEELKQSHKKYQGEFNIYFVLVYRYRYVTLKKFVQIN